MVDNDELKERLLILRDRLENASGVSPSDRDLWTSLMAEIIAISENKQLSNNSAQLGFRELWTQKSSAYEVDHPEIAYTVRQVLDMLAKMGI
ncbi:DUF4404 family protein [Porticoccaceae bacterium]|nr:DUF4404 family protein [Porticoccaceae bacterium]